MLSAAELADMRTVQAQAMTGTCVISRKTLIADGMGGYTETWAAAGTVSGRVWPASESGAESLIADRITESDAWVITVPYATDITAKDRVVADGRTFEVVSAIAHTWETARRVVATEVGA
jgi:SPP1 family predicted phage head-tail adaptor